MMACASAALVWLGNPEVTQLVSLAVLNLVEGEMLRMNDVIERAVCDVTMRLNSMERSQKYQDMWNTYLQKSYLKTASPIAKGVCSAVILGGCVQGEIWREIAYAYGQNFGIAYQVSGCALFNMMYIFDLSSLWMTHWIMNQPQLHSENLTTRTSHLVLRPHQPLMLRRRFRRWVN